MWAGATASTLSDRPGRNMPVIGARDRGPDVSARRCPDTRPTDPVVKERGRGRPHSVRCSLTPYRTVTGGDSP
jgi:hypothetical protein